MHTKVFRICSPVAKAEDLLHYYDTVLTPAILVSEKHIGQQLIETQPGEWILISSYVSHDAALLAEPLFDELLRPMKQQFRAYYEAIGEGNATRSI